MSLTNFNTKGLLILGSCLWAIVSTPTAHAVEYGFSNASLNGTYSTLGIGRGGVSPVARLMTVTLNGKGAFYGKIVSNRPDDDHKKRIIVNRRIKGEYHINKDGTGALKIAPLEEGGEPLSGQLLITRTLTNPRRKGQFATEFAIVLDDLLAVSKALQTAVFKRLPHYGGKFSNRSFKGTYASRGIGRGGASPVAGLSMITADGKGGFTGKTTVNRPNSKYGSRQVISFPIKGRYHINRDGTGTITLVPPPELGEPQSGQIMATQARSWHNGYQIVTGLSFVLDELLPAASALQTAELQRLGN